MKVSMKQARRIEREIGAEIELNTQDQHGIGSPVAVSIYENMIEKLDDLQKETLASVLKVQELIRIRFAIRKAIETVNEISGINKLMNEEAGLKALAKVMNNVMTGELTDADRNIALQRHATLKAQIENGNPPQSRYGEPTDAITMGNVLSTTTMNKFRDDAKVIQRSLLEVVDRLSALNANAQVEISDADVQALEAAGIVV
ncbi:hypothetical protein [Acinetobacter sp.]|uniref:hypothetical protein n=1 Tax=Acinetobacter sp. TaxID=472 RepID=UPI00388E06FE